MKLNNSNAYFRLIDMIFKMDSVGFIGYLKKNRITPSR